MRLSDYESAVSFLAQECSVETYKEALAVLEEAKLKAREAEDRASDIAHAIVRAGLKVE
jgi:hypothetical protein